MSALCLLSSRCCCVRWCPLAGCRARRPQPLHADSLSDDGRHGRHASAPTQLPGKHQLAPIPRRLHLSVCDPAATRSGGRAASASRSPLPTSRSWPMVDLLFAPDWDHVPRAPPVPRRQSTDTANRSDAQPSRSRSCCFFGGRSCPVLVADPRRRFGVACFPPSRLPVPAAARSSMSAPAPCCRRVRAARCFSNRTFSTRRKTGTAIGRARPATTTTRTSARTSILPAVSTCSTRVGG